MSRALDESVTLEDILTIVSAKRVPLAPELAGYLALEISEQCKDEGEVEAASVYVSEEGSLAVVRGRRGSESVAPSFQGAAETSIRTLLGKLLEATGSQTPALAAAARKKSGEGIASLREDLEAALIPVNRAAGRRALARLAREVKRVVLGVGRNASVPPSERGSRGSSANMRTETRSDRAPSATSFDAEESPTTARREIPAEVLADASRDEDHEPTLAMTREDRVMATLPSNRDAVDSLLDTFEVSERREDKALSRELKAMVGLDPTPPPPPAFTKHDAESRGLRPKVKASLSDAPAPRSISYADERQLPTAPSQLKRLSLTNEASRGKGVDRVIVVIVLLLVAVLVAALWTLKPGFFTGRTPEKIQQEKESSDRERLAMSPAIPQCRTSLVLDGAPDDAEILWRVGQAPTDIDKMPVGVRLEFVATAEGYTPKRAVVPASTPWESSLGKPRFEVAVQLDKSKAKLHENEAWPPGEPGSEVGGKGSGTPGVVHVVSSPKGAEIWLLLGLGPRTTAEDLAACDTDLDLLVAGPKAYRKRLHVTASQFLPDASRAGWRVAKITIPPVR